MYFWVGITTLAVLGVWGIPAKAQVGEKQAAEEILTAAAEIQQKLFDKFELDGSSTANCLINGVKSRNIDILQLQRLANSIKSRTDVPCNSLENDWKYDFQDFLEPDNFPHNSEKALSTTCGKYPSAVWSAVLNGETQLTKEIILGLLATVQPNVTTPDAIALLENSVKIIENLQVDAFYVHQTNDILLEISKQVMTQNHLNPTENYQLTEMAAAQASIQQITNFNILSIIRPGAFPQDVIKARDVIAKGIDDGHLDVCVEGGWSTPPDQLLALVTSLTTVSNQHHLAASVHVLYSHVRMWYFCMYGYQYVPRTFNDIVFLLNSFLTIRNPILLQEVYLEFSKIPWQEYTTHMDFKQYCDPRSLMTDIIKSILDHPDSLKVCNTIILNYFINADEDCPSWLKPMFPTNSTENPPFEVIPPRKEHRQPTTTEAPTTEKSIDCEEGETKVIEPESLIDIFDSKRHPVIAAILRENPYPVESIMYNSREAAFKQIIGDLINTRTDYSDLKKRALRYAEQDLLLNERRVLPVELGCLCLMDDSDVVCTDGEKRVINPESLIAIFDNSKYPLLEEFLNYHLSASDAGDRYTTLIAILREHDAHISEELRTIFKLFLGANPPINQKGRWSVTWMCQHKLRCNLVTVVSQDSLIGIIDEGKITPIKKVVYWKPVFFNDYKGLETREQILKKVLADRSLELKDDVLPLVLAQAIKRMRISWKGMLPPIIGEVCEHDLKHNYEYVEDEAPVKTCDNVTVINQQSLIDIMAENRIIVLRNLVFMEPVLYADYGYFQSREEVLRSVLYDRMVKVNDEVLNLVVPEALTRLQINWRGMLPPMTEIKCKTDLAYNIVTPVPPIDDDIVCEDSVPEAPDCGADQDAILIADTSSLFDALDGHAPRATVTRQKIRATVYPINTNVTNLKSYVLRDILLNLREEAESQRLAYEIDQLLVSIYYREYGLEPVAVKYICQNKKHECGVGEQLVEAIDVSSLWGALKQKTPIPLHIIESAETYLVPAKKSKSYQKSVVLREILEDILNDTDDLPARGRIIELIGAIRHDGPALEDALHILKCIPDDVSVKAPCDEDDEREELDMDSSEIKPTVLPFDIENQELSVEECEDPEEVTTPYPPTTTETAVESSEECEDSEEVTTPYPITTTTTETAMECEESEELASQYPAPTTAGTLLDSWEVYDYSDEVDTPQPLINDTPHPTTETLMDLSEDCEDSEEVPTPQSLIDDTPSPSETVLMPTEECEDEETTSQTNVAVEAEEECIEEEDLMRIPSPTEETVTESSLECEESEEVTTEEPTTEHFTECDENEDTTTTEGTTLEPVTTPDQPKFDEPCKKNNWPLLLKVNLGEICFDETSMALTHPVDFVSVGELLMDAEGTSDDKYIISAKLAGLDTYQPLQTFDWEAYCTRGEFFNALMQHIGFETALIQRSTEPVAIRTVCRKTLVDAMPRSFRKKRQGEV